MDQPSGHLITSPLLQRLARGEIDLHQLVVIRLGQMRTSPLSLRRHVPPELEFNNLMQFYRGERLMCNADDTLTPRWLAKVLNLNQEEAVLAHQLGLETLRARSTTKLSLESLSNSRPVRPVSHDPPPKIVRFASLKERQLAVAERRQLGAELRSLRIRLQWRIVDVSDLVGFSPSTIAGIEKGEMAMTIENVHKVKQQLEQALVSPLTAPKST